MDLDALKADIARDEGWRLFPYDDATGEQLKPGMTLKGNITIAAGVNLSAGVSNDEATYLTNIRITSALADLDRELPWWTRLDEPRQRVLANMSYNLGIEKLLLFRHTLDAMARGDYVAAADGMAASLWASQVGPRAQRLIAVMRGE